MSLSQVVATMVFKSDTKGLDKANQKFSKLTGLVKGAGVALVGSLTARAVMSAIDSTTKGLTDLALAANKLGVETDQLQGFRFAAESMGLSAGTLDNGLKKLSETMGKASDNKNLKQEFHQLGISLTDSTGKAKTSTEVMKDLNRTFQNVPSAARRAAIANKLLGRAGIELLPMLSQTEEAFDKQLQTFKDLGGPAPKEAIERSKQYQEQQAKMKVVTDSLKESLVDMFLSAFGGGNGQKIIEFTKKITDFINGLTPAEKKTAVATAGILGLGLAASKFLGPGAMLLAGLVAIGNYANNEFSSAMKGGESTLVSFLENMGISAQTSIGIFTQVGATFKTLLDGMRLAAEVGLTFIIDRFRGMVKAALGAVELLGKIPGMGNVGRAAGMARAQMAEEDQNRVDSLKRSGSQALSDAAKRQAAASQEAAQGANLFKQGQIARNEALPLDVRHAAADKLEQAQKERKEGTTKQFVFNQDLTLTNSTGLEEQVRTIGRETKNIVSQMKREMLLAEEEL